MKMARNYYRKGIDPGFLNTRLWIEKWMGDSSGISISCITIDLPDTKNGVFGDGAAYKEAFRGKETPLHAHLKYAMFKWLEKEIGGFPVYEQKIYSPIDELAERCSNRRALIIKDREWIFDDFDPSVPQLIEKGRVIYQHCGIDISADVYCQGVSVEIGYTQPFNLLTPLLDGVVNSAIWVPFPKGVESKRFDPFVSGLEAVAGYKFARRSPRHARRTKKVSGHA